MGGWRLSVHKCETEVRKLSLWRIRIVSVLINAGCRSARAHVKGTSTVTMKASFRKLLAAGSAGLDVCTMEWPVVLASLEC